jgi:hypothetical protein
MEIPFNAESAKEGVSLRKESSRGKGLKGKV